MRLTDAVAVYEEAPTDWLAGPFVACAIGGAELLDLVNVDLRHAPEQRMLDRIWPDFAVKPLLHRSIDAIGAATIAEDYGATGENIVWAVIDSGIDASHSHFQTYDTLSGSVASLHRDFTQPAWRADPIDALTDERGHGTHVAGIIAGALVAEPAGVELHGFGVYGEEHVVTPVDGGDDDYDDTSSRVKERWAERQGISARSLHGVAPRCKLVSLKVLTAMSGSLNEPDRTSTVIKALEYVLVANAQNRVIHGVNLSLGYEWGPDWPDCGQSPICEWVDRVVQSGVVVVAAAGNTGYGILGADERPTYGGIGITINDPGNARGAITVGSTNAEDPLAFGVSYFSSKGPTADGRLKPDLVAPGERVVSCATAISLNGAPESTEEHPHANYREMNGTSQAAPHVSGGIAAFLSAHPEYIGRPAEIRKLFVVSAHTLERNEYFQGHGLLNVAAVLQESA
jgi:subtilisin family serine protease